MNKHKTIVDEYTGSEYTKKLVGALPKIKANMSQGIPEMIERDENGKLLTLEEKFAALGHNRSAKRSKDVRQDLIDAIKAERKISLGSAIDA